MTITFTKEKETKNTVRFTEQVRADTDAPKVGTLYVPKATLNELNWHEGQALVMELGVN